MKSVLIPSQNDLGNFSLKFFISKKLYKEMSKLYFSDGFRKLIMSPKVTRKKIHEIARQGVLFQPQDLLCPRHDQRTRYASINKGSLMFSPSLSTITYSWKGKSNIEQIIHYKGNVCWKVQGAVFAGAYRNPEEVEGLSGCLIFRRPLKMSRNLPGIKQRVAPERREDNGT